MPRTYRILLADPGLNRRADKYRKALAVIRPGWSLTFAEDIRDVPSLLDHTPADGVVLGPAGTPDMLETLDRIREDHPDTSVLLVGATARAEAVRENILTIASSQEGGSWTPDGVLFGEELEGPGGPEALAAQLSAALYRRGRVDNEVGILVTHGTDTLAWGFAYLRYALKGLTANVAVTGSQIPLGGYFSDSDALGNLKTAVLLLNRLRPGRLFAVFNEGRSVFTGRLTKYRKWDTDAFEGKLALSAGRGGIRSFRKDWARIPFGDQRLKELHLIRTGGTIESRPAGAQGALQPTGDFVWKYLNEALSDQFAEAQRHDLFALDSSNMSLEHWAGVAREIESIGVARADTVFDPTVKPVVTNPLFTTEDYRSQFAACGSGAVLAGYGGGNANVLEGSRHGVLPALKASVEAGTFVAVTSQVPLEPYDAEYETGLKLLEAGGVPCGDLPLADAQMKLSYLLGHFQELAAAAREAHLDGRFVLTAAFLSGVSMRRALALETFQRLRGGSNRPLRILPEDPFTGTPFDRALERVIRALVP